MQTTLYQLDLDYSNIDCGMSYAFHMQDGRFFVIDGGYQTKGEEDRLYKFLKERSEGIPLIAGWFFTHAHDDHVGNFIQFICKYRDKVTIEKLMYNFQPIDLIDVDSATEAMTKSFYETAAKYCCDIPVITLQTGEIFHIGDIEIEVLFTYNDLDVKNKNVTFNDCSTVIMTTIADQKILWFGDLEVEGGRILLQNKKDKLVCDIVQVSHHGFRGVSIDVYEATQAKIALWSTPDYVMEWIKDNNPYIRNNFVNQYILNDMNIQEHLISGNGMVEMKLPYEMATVKSYPQRFFGCPQDHWMHNASKHRILGRTGLYINKIGMGTEHLLDKDEQIIIDTIQTAIKGGVNYFDCHVGHDFQEDSIEYEGYAKLAKALKGHRENVYISYLTFYKNRTTEFTQPRFEYFLKTLDTDHVDVFVIQFCDKEADYEYVIGSSGALDYAKKLRWEGKTRNIGIATHSTEIALKAIKSKEFDVIMFPINPAFDVVVDEEQYKTDKLDTLWDAAHDFSGAEKNKVQPRKSVYLECERNDIGLIAMKPFAGGFIFRAEKEVGFTPINLASYALDQNGVSVIIPGCTKPEEISEILEYHTATESERDYSAAVAKSRWSVTGNCIYCNHCMPCSESINIGQVNRFIDSFLHDPNNNIDDVNHKYQSLSTKASACTKCGICVERCPFKVDVIARMEQAVDIFGR
ncbi:MAG: aldo/keto reductase [Oscillospiraceae bacterium]|nr:aldo/keto reductase [Oscillospiraceae bacterium]